jgi:hypothetical protein
MQTVTETTAPRKAPRAYRAIQDETAGTLTQLDGQLVFFSDAGEITTVEPQAINFLTVLGEIGLADTQALMDRIHGGAAAICTSRQMLEV